MPTIPAPQPVALTPNQIAANQAVKPASSNPVANTSSTLQTAVYGANGNLSGYKDNSTGIFTPVAKPATIPNTPVTPQNPNPVSNQSTTTLSSNKSPDITSANSTYNNLSQKGVSTDTTTGIATHADGSVYTPPTLLSTDTTDEDAKVQANLDTMKANTDAITAANITSIQNRYAGLIEAQKKVNESQLGATTNALLNSGAAQHDVYSNDAIKARIDEGTKQIKDLENEENDLINAAKAAQLTSNNKLLETLNTQIQAKRDEKIAQTKLLNDDIIKETTKARDLATQAKIDQSIANAYSLGTTDVPSIISALKAKGIDVTSKQVSDALTNIVPKGLDDLVKTLRQNVAPADLISQVLSSKSLDEAYRLAQTKDNGAWIKTGVGQAAEYYGYVRDSLSANLPYVGWTEYQNQDANRKAKATAAATGAAGVPLDITQFNSDVQSKLKKGGFTAYSNTTQDLASQLVNGQIAPSELSKRTTGTSSYNDVLSAANAYSKAITGKAFNIATADRNYKFAQRPQTQDTLNFLGSLVGSANDKGDFSGGNLDELTTLSNSIGRTNFPALNDIKAWAGLSTGNVDYAKFQAVATEVADQVAKILQGGTSGGGTSDAKLQQAVNLFNIGFSKDQLAGVINALKPLLANRASNMIKDNPYLSNYADQFGVSQNLPNGTKANTGGDIIKAESDAQSKVDAAAKADKNIAKTVYDQLSKPDPTLGRVMTYSEVLQYLQAIGKLK